jgi:predicted transcriptional regulator
MDAMGIPYTVEAVKQTAIKASMNMMKSYIRDYEMGQESIGKFLDLMEAKIELIAGITNAN